jgi:hypothetical protein
MGGGGGLGGIVDAVAKPVQSIVNNPGRALSGGVIGNLVMGPAGLVGGALLGGAAGDKATQAIRDRENALNYGYANQPAAPEFESQIDPATGMLKQQYQQKSQLNEGGLEAMRGEALRDPSKMSKWREIAQTQGMDQLGRQQGNQLAQAQSGLAAAGGLSQGARERLQQSSMQQGLMGQQNMWTQLAAQDEQKRQQMLGQLPGQELAAAGYKSGIGGGNIQSALDEINRKRAFDMNRYNQQMGAWGAQQTANAVQVPEDKGFLGNMFDGLF